ncbi:MAG: 1-acyl-sn-glycerol-3-phosphate acyltransferase [Chloroflexi bacterium]|nr:1-acyl-sn-glycerol-3-phosphate acyltransferase [Chloroflexota bacterium]MYJ01539.1 1-acyl-sn-glycerol-3-phosphate acyltransferase [Chloroflexota bacterium]
MRRRAYRWTTRQLTRLFFGEYEALANIGMTGMPNASRVWFLVAGFLARLAFLRVVRCEWIHFQRIPKGAVIIASNHVSSADPAMMASAMYPRSPRYMAKVELFQKEPVLGYLFALSGAFPVRRGAGDRLAIREAERLLSEGAAVGMFPEGHRSDTGAMMQAHSGTALLALRSRAPVVAVGITGSERMRAGWRALFARTQVRMTASHPFVVQPAGRRITRDDIDRAHTTIMRAIAEQLPPAYRGVYAHLVDDVDQRTDSEPTATETPTPQEPGART